MSTTPQRYNRPRMAEIIQLGDADDDAAGEDRARSEETAWLEQVRDRGDRGAFEALFARLTPRLVAWTRAQGCEPALAETVVQDVMLAAWTRAHRFDAARASARTWLYSLARNRMIDYFRSRGRRERAHDALAQDVSARAQDDDASTPDAAADAERERLLGFLEQLPPEQREVLLMVYIEGHSHRDIAAATGTPIGTVKSRARLAFRRLRSLMEDAA